MRPVTRRQADHHAARSAATRAQVMRTLERLLDSGDVFSEISVQRILEEAGVSRATFYAHFDSKSDRRDSGPSQGHWRSRCRARPGRRLFSPPTATAFGAGTCGARCTRSPTTSPTTSRGHR